MNQTYGVYHDIENTCQEYLNLVFSPSSLPIEQRWRNNDLSADFLANYFSTFFPVRSGDPASAQRQAEIKSAISFIANELLENAMKYCDGRPDDAISLQLQLHSDSVLFVSSNGLDAAQAERFQASIQELLASDPGDLYVQRLETSAEQDNVSGLGFLTMLNDYAAELGWKFEFPEAETATGKVISTVRISI
jgi:hypothetical protein